MLKTISMILLSIAISIFVYNQYLFLFEKIEEMIFVYKEKQKCPKNIELLKLENNKYIFSMNFFIYKISKYLLNLNKIIEYTIMNIDKTNFKSEMRIKYKEIIVNYYCDKFKFLDKNKIDEFNLDIETKTITFTIEAKYNENNK